MKKTFSSINREKLLDRADDIAVLQAYTQTRKWNGNRLEILCPFHDDNHFGSCWYFRKDRKVYCFVCHEGGNIIDVVMKKHGWSESQQAYDAMREIAQLSGVDLAEVSDSVTPEDQERMKALPPMLTPEEMKVLGLFNDPVRVTSFQENDPDSYQNETWISNPLGKLRQDDAEEYRRLVISKAKEAISDDNQTIMQYRNSIAKCEGNIHDHMVGIRMAYRHSRLAEEILRKFNPE